MLKLLKLLLPVCFLFLFFQKANAYYELDQNRVADFDFIIESGENPVSSLKVFAWNVAWGKFNGNSHLDHNLYAISSSVYSPDVIVLSEFKSSILGATTMGHLDWLYPYSTYKPYSATSAVGIKVWSKHPLTPYSSTQLDWAPYTSAASRASYRYEWDHAAHSHVQHWERPFFFVRLNKAGRDYYVVPVHLLSPYSAMLDKEGHLWTANQAMRKTSNPLGYQIGRLKAHLKANFGNQYLKHRFVMVGDFNIPDKIMGVRPAMFEQLWRGMKRVKLKGAASFPAKGTTSLGRLEPFLGATIDHAFVSPLISNRRGRVLSMSGSDHYPLYLVID